MSIQIQYTPNAAGVARGLSQCLQADLAPAQPAIVLAGPDGALPGGPPEWDDVLLVAFAGDPLSATAVTAVDEFRQARSVPGNDGKSYPGGFVLPVAIEGGPAKPPQPVDGIKSLCYDAAGRGKAGSLARALKVRLGLAIRPGNHRVFVSYRSSDGGPIAQDLFHRLEEAGFLPWLDEARENLQPGDDVQQVIQRQIHESLTEAGIVLLVDTPEAPKSPWIRVELDIAQGDLVPVIPVVAGKSTTRFNRLLTLRRAVAVKPQGPDGAAMSDAEWQGVLAGLENFLLEIHRRRMLVPARTQAAFEQFGYAWKPIDAQRRFFHSERLQRRQPPLCVLTHCSVFDPQYIPGLHAYRAYVQNYGNLAGVNFKLYVYDAPELLSDVETDELVQELGAGVIPAHYQELISLLNSNFRPL